ncbi:MAG TPA: MMPL family transporter [Acidimicrobiales bacterium]|jgi:RND superfamily putative drug exporter|nr:MMPL family transporter [Acidimicrobiales bacterium]
MADLRDPPTPAVDEAIHPDRGAPDRTHGTAVPPSSLGPLGRLGRWSAARRGTVFLAWLAIVAVLAVFAPSVEHALSGAGWQADGSQSVQVRNLAQKDFGGQASSAIEVVIAANRPVSSPSVQAVMAEAERILAADPRIGRVVAPQPGVSIAPNGRTAVILAGAAADPNGMVRAADALKEPLRQLSGNGVTVAATGASVLWSDFNAANRTAMLRSEMISWPVTLAILLLAFGALVAAGLPLLLTLVGLLSAAGLLDLLTHITPISIWAMNFALMFALALGIDYALFIVVRFRGAHFGRHRHVGESVGETMDTAGKAVLFSGLTVLIALSTVMLVPAPAFRSMAAGIMLAVFFVLLATLTLLPAVLGKLGDNVDALPLRWVHSGEHRSARFARWGELLWRRPWLFGSVAVAVLVLLAAPVIGLRTAMPSIKVVPSTDSARVGYDLVQSAFGAGAPGQLQIITVPAHASEAAAVLSHDPSIAAVMPAQRSQATDLVLINAVPRADPSSPTIGTTIDRLRGSLPSGSLVGGAAAENYDLQVVLTAKTPEVVGLVLLLGFLVLLIALQAPLIAALGVLTSLLATGAAFGVARLVFQNGWLHQLLGFTPQGFLDAWGPVFFFAMIFAISMDYTVFLLSSAKEHYERSGDPKDAMVNGLAHSGRVIFAAAAVMVAVFFTFALSGPLPPKEMGIILGVAVLLDALLVRLLLLPVLLRLTGNAAWWAPNWLKRVLPPVRFAHE